MGLRRGDLLLRVDRINDVCWILDLEELDKDRYDLATDRVCSLEEIEVEQPQVQGLESLPDGHLVQPRSKPLLKELSVEERLTRKLMHLLSCFWCETCVEPLDMEEPHCVQRGGRDYTFMGWRAEKDQIYAFHVIDMEFLERTVIRTNKGSTDDVIYGVLEPLGEISRKRIVICNDNEPMVKKPDQAVALHRENDMVVKESSQSIGCNEHNHFLVGGMTWVLRIDMDNRFDNNFLVLHVMYTRILRHSGWLLNRFCVARNGDTTFQRYKGRIYNCEMCDFFECALLKVLIPDGVKLDNQFYSDVWIGETSKNEGHLIFDGDDVQKCWTVEKRPECLRWNHVRVDGIDTLSQQSTGECILRDRLKRYMNAAMVKQPSTSGVDEAETESTSTATSMISNVKCRAVHGGIFNCKACVVDWLSHSKERRKCSESIFRKKDEEKTTREATDVTAGGTPDRGGYFVDRLSYHHDGIFMYETVR